MMAKYLYTSEMIFWMGLLTQFFLSYMHSLRQLPRHYQSGHRVPVPLNI